MDLRPQASNKKFTCGKEPDIQMSVLNKDYTIFYIACQDFFYFFSFFFYINNNGLMNSPLRSLIA